MIVPMKKVSLVVLESKKRDALKKLRKEGIVHLNTLDVKGSSVEQLKVEKQVLESTLQKLSEIGKSVEKTQNRTLKTINGEKEFVELHENVIQLLKSEDKLKEEIQKLSLEKEKLAPWGDFSVEDIKNLKEKDVDLNFYFVGKKESSLIEEDINYLILQRGKKSNLIATVNRELNDGLGAQKLTLPKYSLSEIEQNVATKKEELTKIFDQLVEYSDYTPTYKKEIEVVEQDLNFEIASDSMGVDEKLAYIAGYLPIDVVLNVIMIQKAQFFHF
jgi:V/A-type H+-transporting ATPase subunit I